MILYENEKYSCVKCIRGHRSTSCKHIDRVLIKVNKRGRKNAEGKSLNNTFHSNNISANNEDVIVVEELSNVNISKKEEAVSISSYSEQSYIKVENDDISTKGSVSSCCNNNNISNNASSPAGHEENCKSIKQPLLLLQPRASLNNQTQTASPESITKSCCKKEEDNENIFEKNNNIQEENFNYKKQKTLTNFDIFKNNNVLLETKCSCADDSCQCENCIIHRLDEDLDYYISSNLLTYPSKIVGKGFIQQNNDIPELAQISSLEDTNKVNIIEEKKVVSDVISLKDIFQKGFNNLIHKITPETKLIVNDKELVYVAWYPQVELYNRDIITLSQLVKILETL
ncbi:copper-fist-domain-containing protein [Hanseniaspora valbyensis NRRL Y-1626]|uniref:Copper-fist-domain-containing protein n=1 Tax=Hanseniaspora valbyensis NRRL Y-1626 TaxID=766949 RepID=A0A1B7TJR4_9ASCO|nr:copper-fist-domain-containing protein [Hanseniaspora valbyensis NRRL Y-1626]